MPFIEQMLFGVDIRDTNPARSVLAHSPGMEQDTRDEIVRLIENWGTVPPLGLEHPALMSFRLTSSASTIAGRLFAVIRASRGLNPLFHAVVLSEGAFATFQRNPFALAAAVNFCDEWDPDLKLNIEEIEYDPLVPLVDPLPGKNDIGLVDEAVLKLIADGKLLMPIEQANARSDRSLALIIACMPEKERKNLRFASFSPSDANGYSLAGLNSEGCVFAGWQRMMMAWVAGTYVKEVEDFITEIRKYLETGDLAGISRTTLRHQIQAGSRPESPDKMRRETVSAAMPVQESQPDPWSKQFKGRPPQAKPAMAAMPPKPPAAALQRPAVSPPSRNPVPGPSRNSGSAPRPKRRKLSPLIRNSPGSPAPFRNRNLSSRSMVRTVLLILVLAVAGSAAVMWKEGKTLVESLEWANQQMTRWDRPRTERAATLLEVVDVGGVYARQLKLVTGSGKGLNPSVDRGRHKALGNLREDAAVPLTQQVNLFAKLAGDGIQQGSRPDRESQRMQSLANQGLVLENELARLELAWYSLAAGVFWRDLGTMSDAAVIARRDSLGKSTKGALEDARRDLGTQEAKTVLDQTRGNVNGMASLITLFAANSWSQGWERDLARAAGQVAPNASRMTRAYANSAFAFLSLKKAEKSGLQTSLPYGGELKDQAWPSADIRGLLTNLRAQTLIFTDGQAPALLTATLNLYTALKRPAGLAAKVAADPRVLANLQDNHAVRFHPEAYVDFLERVRFEAALLSLEGTDDPERIPAHLYQGGERDLVIVFRETIDVHHTPAAWDSLAASAGRPFLARWAGHRASLSRIDLVRSRAEFDKAWIVCRQAAVRLQDEASAGRDWTDSWVELNDQVQLILRAHGRNLAQDQDRSLKLADLTNLLLGIKATLPLELQAGTIRLDQDRLLEGTKARLEIKVVPDGKVWRSDRFYIGPAAPEGAGWVGTVSLEKSLEILPRQGLEVSIIAEKREEILLQVTCPPLTEGVGPGGMTRPRSGGRGSVSLKIDPSYWKALRVPDLGMIF